MNRYLKILIRAGTILLLTVILWGCGVVPSLKEGSEGIYVRLPFVRILLDQNQREVIIGSTSAFSLECRKGSESYVYHGSKPLTIRLSRGSVSVGMNKMGIGDNLDEVLVIPRGKHGRLIYEGKNYRGMFRITPRGTKLQLINIVHMDDYLKGVVPPEIGFFKDAELEAIKAQAVAARTYAMSHLAQYSGEEYDMKADVSDQIYLGVAVENDNVSRAVDATRGYVIKYRGKFINAYYHSTCGGYTDDIDQVWEKAGQPYLRAVNDSGYCDWSKYYEWVESYSPKQMQLMLEQYLSAERGRRVNVKAIQDIFVKSTTAGGRVAEVVVKTADNEYTFGKDKLRWIFKRASNPELILQSARFRVSIDRDSAGTITRIHLHGGGYGHGVGMCQCGAIGMARRGWNYQDILAFYYRNIGLVKLY